MNKDPRYIANRILVQWDTSSRTLDQVLMSNQSRIEQLSEKDKKLCNAIVFGVLRHRLTLDWMLKTCSNTPIEKIQKPLIYLMRAALFQILHLDRIPDFAAIDTAVSTASQLKGKKAAGFTNAVLRNVLRKKDSIVWPDVEKQPDTALAVQYATPIWLTKKWMKAYGRNATETLLKNIQRIPKITIRTNTLKTTRDDLFLLLDKDVKNLSRIKGSENALDFDSPGIPIDQMESFQKGWFQIQDLAAQMVTELLDPKPGERVLDACAGLGGKTGHIAQLMENQGRVTACDIESSKLETLKTQMQRLGVDCVKTRTCNLSKTSIKDFKDYFDRVLLDAPCTGLGVLRRNPDTRWKRAAKDIQRMAGQQKKLLNAAANLVKPGGVLVFAVCSCEKEENDDIVEHFLGKRKDFVPDAENMTFFDPDIAKDGWIKTYPYASGMDGFFAVRFRRKIRKKS